MTIAMRSKQALLVEFKAVMVLREITQNYGNYRYDNYLGNAPGQ